MKFPMWTLESGLATVRGIQSAVKPRGWHVALGGGVLNRGESQKDLDLYFLPLTVPCPETKQLLYYLTTLWGRAEPFGVEDSNYSEEQSYRYRGKFFLLGTRRIDVFII